MVLLFIRKTTGTTLAIDIDVQSTVLALKETLHAIDGSSPSRQTLIFAGRVLKDDASLVSYNITKECSIQLFTSAVQRLKDGEEIKNGENPSATLVELTPESQQLEGKRLAQRITNGSSTLVPASTRSQQPEGGVCDVLRHGDIVVIRLLEAKNLERADFWPVLSGTSDPYVIFALGNNSAKSKIIRRNLNPVWNETFGFRINEEDERAVLRVLVFDFDNFTPDDFIGSVEINLSGLQRGKMIDRWVDLQNVKTGQIHLQFHRSILTSPSLNTIVTSLMELERSWTPEDLSRHGIKLEHLTGELAWFTENTTNPAIEHLAESIRMGNIDWKTSSLARIETILTSQGLCTTPGLPTPYIWFSGISGDCSVLDLINEIRKHAEVKHINFASNGCAFVGFRSVSDSLLCFLYMQHKHYHNDVLELGFGRYIPRNDPFLTSCLRAGFLYIFHPNMTNWIYGWMFLVNGSIHFFGDLQNELPTFSMDLGHLYICSHGPNSIELYDKERQESVFIRSESDKQIIDWKLVFRKIQSFSSPGSIRTEPEFANEGKFQNIACVCIICSKEYPLSEVYFHSSNPSISNNYVCIYCLREIILKKVESGEVASLSPEFTVQDIRDLLCASEFESYLDSSLRELLDADDNFVKCPKCSVAVEFVRDGGQDMPDFTRLAGVDGKPISVHTQSHYLNNRLRCRNTQCTIDFCRSCLETPYHAGFECDEFKIFKSAEHCRFCDCALLAGKTLATDPPSKALERCCNQADCLRKRDQACLEFLPCGHYCGGVRGETHHPHCLFDEVKSEHITQDHSDFCNICFTESLGSSPIIELDCGHFFHFECVKKRLSERWSTPQITFGFCKCPLCKINIHHELLIHCLSPIWELHRDIESKAYNRLIYEGLLKSEELQENGPFYRNAMGYAIQYFAYYMCFKCKVPYFGGQPRCNDGLDHFDPSELVCGPCSGIGVSECATHGKEFIQFKCRFCCNLSTWYCWGTTHFCDDCHRRQEAHDYMSTKSQDELVQCEGPAKCPLGLEHPPNGEEFSLGCSLCRGGAAQQESTQNGSPE